MLLPVCLDISLSCDSERISIVIQTETRTKQSGHQYNVYELFVLATAFPMSAAFLGFSVDCPWSKGSDCLPIIPPKDLPTSFSPRILESLEKGEHGDRCGLLEPRRGVSIP